MSRPLVYLGFNRWDSIKQREQHLIEHLARQRPVLYVDPYYTLRQLSSPGQWHGGRLQQLDEQLYRYTPPSWFLPFHIRSRIVSELNARGMAWLVRRQLRRLGFSSFLLGVGHPRSAPLARRLAAARRYYDCMDDHGAFPVSGVNFELLGSYETELLRASDLVFASATSLAEHCQRQHPSVIRIPNGVNLDHFQDLEARGLAVPAPLAEVRGPIIGYYGAIAPWLDLEALEHLAAARPDLSVVLIGPCEHGVDLTALRAHANVHWLGPRPYEELPAYLRLFQVGLIPFRMSPLIEKVNPTKLYEYLAAGKPVVASPLPEVVAHGGTVRIYREAPELVKQVEAALGDSDPERVADRVAIAGAHAWDQLAARMHAALESLS